MGVDILPRHFYSEVPDIRALRENRRWQRRYTMAGVAADDLDGQLRWLEQVCPPELTRQLPSLDLQHAAGRANGALGYGPIDADLLYCIIRTKAPRRVIQVGAGVSTWIALKAAEDAGHAVDITCVDPYPTEFLQRLDAEGRIHLRTAAVQDLPPAELTALGPGDLLFIDSTHTVAPGSDVNFMILEVLPRLPKGVLVHFHDITTPYDFHPTLLSDQLFFWSESVLLHAYLADNPRFEMRLGMAMLHDAALDRVQKIIPTYRRPLVTERGIAIDEFDGPYASSMWLECVADPRQ